MNRIFKKIFKIDMRIVMLLSIIMIVFIVHQFLNNLLKSYEKAAEIKEGLNPLFGSLAGGEVILTYKLYGFVISLFFTSSKGAYLSNQ